MKAIKTTEFQFHLSKIFRINRPVLRKRETTSRTFARDFPFKQIKPSHNAITFGKYFYVLRMRIDKKFDIRIMKRENRLNNKISKLTVKYRHLLSLQKNVATRCYRSNNL